MDKQKVKANAVKLLRRYLQAIEEDDIELESVGFRREVKFLESNLPKLPDKHYTITLNILDESDWREKQLLKELGY